MIEPIMYFGIGFLVAALIGLLVIPLIQRRAVRLTMQRLEATAPLSISEIQADKDKLRADFAMSTRRLETSVEALKSKSVGQLAELNKTADTMGRLKAELGEKNPRFSHSKRTTKRCAINCAPPRKKLRPKPTQCTKPSVRSLTRSRIWPSLAVNSTNVRVWQNRRSAKLLP
jgi:hypothetical protein